MLPNSTILTAESLPSANIPRYTDPKDPYGGGDQGSKTTKQRDLSGLPQMAWQFEIYQAAAATNKQGGWGQPPPPNLNTTAVFTVGTLMVSPFESELETVSMCTVSALCTESARLDTVSSVSSQS